MDYHHDWSAGQSLRREYPPFPWDKATLYCRSCYHGMFSADTLVQGGKFKIQVSFPSEYPFKPPKIHWQTKIYHPNVSSDDKGYMCLGMLRDGEWKPNTMMSAALEYIRQLLVEPDPEDSTEGAIAQQYKEDRKEFNKQAKKWTKDHAK